MDAPTGTDWLDCTATMSRLRAVLSEVWNFQIGVQRFSLSINFLMSRVI